MTAYLYARLRKLRMLFLKGTESNGALRLMAYASSTYYKGRTLVAHFAKCQPLKQVATRKETRFLFDVHHAIPLAEKAFSYYGLALYVCVVIEKRIWGKHMYSGWMDGYAVAVRIPSTLRNRRLHQ